MEGRFQAYFRNIPTTQGDMHPMRFPLRQDDTLSPLNFL